jgi:RNA polymerase sigma factor (sigma-70 family)
MSRVFEVIARSVVGRDRAALAAALDEHRGALLAIARLLVRDEAEARDLVQQTLEIALRHLDELRDPARLGPWLTTIEAREAFRMRRRMARFVRLNEIWRTPQAIEAPDASSNVALKDALGRLPSRIRAALVLHHMAGLSVAETAHAMSVRPNTVKSQLKVGLRRLREMLDD